MSANIQALTFRDIFRLCKNYRLSLLRYATYEYLDGIAVPGTVIDIGGTHDPAKPYKRLLRQHTRWDVLNLSDNADIVADCNHVLPIGDAAYDHAVSFNCFEHVYAIDLAVSEMYRIVKPGGKLILVVPFLYQYHAVPDDFHRKTASWWLKKFVSLGVSEQRISITPLAAWNPLFTSYSIMDNMLRGKLRVPLRLMCLPMFKLLYALLPSCAYTHSFRKSREATCAPGYCIEACK